MGKNPTKFASATKNNNKTLKEIKKALEPLGSSRWATGIPLRFR
jgi:hypothetical protein